MTGTFINKSAGFQTLEQVYLNYQPVKEDRAAASHRGQFSLGLSQGVGKSDVDEVSVGGQP